MATWNVQLLSSCAGERARRQRGSQQCRKPKHNPVQQQADNDDDGSGDEYNDSDDDEMRNHPEPLLSYHEDNQPRCGTQQQEEEHAADEEAINFGNQNDNPLQHQGKNNNDESCEFNGSDDDEMRNHSEPLLSYRENNQPHINQHNHWHIGETDNRTLNNVVGISCTRWESPPPLPDTM